MSTTIKPLFGTSTSITWTSAATLANTNAAGCAAIDNTSNLFLDAYVYIAAAVGTVASPKVINIYGSFSEDGTNYLGNSATTDAYSGTDAAVTLGSPTIFTAPFYFPTQQSSVTAKLVIPSVCKLLGVLILPRKWGLIIENQSGAALTSLSATYTGVNPQNV